MIKGINKQVVEVNDTGNQYYERAILFLKPEYADLQKEILEKEAKKLLKNIDASSNVKRHNRILYWAIRLTPCAVFGALISAIIMNFF